MPVGLAKSGISPAPLHVIQLSLWLIRCWSKGWKRDYVSWLFFITTLEGLNSVILHDLTVANNHWRFPVPSGDFYLVFPGCQALGRTHLQVDCWETMRDLWDQQIVVMTQMVGWSEL